MNFNKLLCLILCWPLLILAGTPMLTYQEVNRCILPEAGPTLHINLFATGFGENRNVKLIITKLNGKKFVVSKKGVIDDQNQLLIGEKPLTLGLNLFGKGEPVTFTIISKNGKLKASVDVVAFPIEAKDLEGHSLSVVVAAKDGLMFNILAKGYRPFERLELCSVSGKEKIVNNCLASENGDFSLCMLPGTLDQIMGWASFEIKGENGKPLKVDYEWGFDALKPYKKEA